MDDNWRCIDYTGHDSNKLLVQGYAGGSMSANMAQILII